MVPKAKPRASSLLALKKSKDAEFRKKSIKNRKTLKNAKKWFAGQEIKRGVIYLSRIPYGFFESGMYKFFRQFGVVKNLKLARSKKTGASCGYAYIEFEHHEVAKIVAKMMDGYLTFGKIMKCQCVPPERVSDKLFRDQNIRPHNCPRVLSRKAAIDQFNRRRTRGQERSRKRKLADAYRKKLDLLKNLGISLDLGLPGVKLQPIGNGVKEKSDADIMEVCEENVELTEEKRAEINEVKEELANKIKASLSKRRAKTRKGEKIGGKIAEDTNQHKPLDGTEHPTNPACKAALSTKKRLGSVKKTTPKMKKIVGKGLVCKKVIKLQNTSEATVIANDESASKNQVLSAISGLNGKKSPINKAAPVKRKLDNNQTRANKLTKRIKAMPSATGSDSQSPSAVKIEKKKKKKSPTAASKSEVTQVQTKGVVVHLPKTGKKTQTLNKAKPPQKSKILKKTLPINVTENLNQTQTQNLLKVVQLSATSKKTKMPKKAKTTQDKIASLDTFLTSIMVEAAQSTEDSELSLTPKKVKILKKTLGTKKIVNKVAQMHEEKSVPANEIQLPTNLEKSVMPKKTKTPKNKVTPEKVLPLKKTQSPSFAQTPKMIKSGKEVVTPEILGSGKKTKFSDKKLLATKIKFKLSTPQQMTPKQKIKPKALKSA